MEVEEGCSSRGSTSRSDQIVEVGILVGWIAVVGRIVGVGVRVLWRVIV